MKRLLLTITIALALFIRLTNSQEQDSQVENVDESSDENLQQENSFITHFLASSEKITELSNSDENLWIDLTNHKNLVLKYISQHKKKRGNILILHAQGENAVHKRLVQPLTKQLLTLGWNVFVPNIISEDFPKKIITPNEVKKIESDESATADIKEKQNNNADTAEDIDATNTIVTPKTFFKDHQDYQLYFDNLCSGIFEQTKILELPLLIITNQHSAYWSINCLKLANAVVPVVFLQPESPNEANDDLKNIFSEQSVPFFSFVPSNKETPFSKTLKKGYWLSKSQKFNQRLITNLKLEEQNYELAKSITGWVERQRKLTQ